MRTDRPGGARIPPRVRTRNAACRVADRDSEARTIEIDLRDTLRRGGPDIHRHLAALADVGTDDLTRTLQARVLLAQLPSFGALVDIDGTLLDVNDRALDLLGEPRDQLVARPLWTTPGLGSTAETRSVLRRLVDLAASGRHASAVVEITGSPRADVPVELTITPVCDDDQAVMFLVAEGVEVTDRRQAVVLLERKNHALVESEARFRAIAENSSDLVCLHDPDGTLAYVSPASHDLLGYEPDELVGAHPATLAHRDDRRLIDRAFHPASRGGPSLVTYRVRHRDGEYRWVEMSLTPIEAAGGGIAELQSSSRDVTVRKQTEEELVRRAFHDELTDLPNRGLLLDRLQQALAVSRRTRRQVAVMFIDLDGFKAVNDRVGHRAGDLALVAVARRLRGIVRPGDTLARFGGDEFVMLCPGLDDPESVDIIARRILEALDEPFSVETRSVTLRASIGIAVGTGESDPAKLVAQADTAMYEAKDRGRNRWVRFDPTRHAVPTDLEAEERALREAIDEGQLVLHYQPELDLTSGAVMGVEALVRWQRDDRLVGPGDFIPLAERSGLIVPIGSWVIGEACRQARRWLDEIGEAAPPTVWVNVSARQLGAPELVPTIHQAIEDAELEPGTICLEITESALMEDAETAARQLDELRALGLRLGVDDFGTGYSSLAYLTRFPLDVLKIDRSFVSGLGTDTHSETIVAAIVDLAHALGLIVIAEGVETDDQLAILRHLDCDQALGYYFGRPASAPDLTRHLVGG